MLLEVVDKAIYLLNFYSSIGSQLFSELAPFS